MRINLYSIAALLSSILGAFFLKKAERRVYPFALQHSGLSPAEASSLQINMGLSYAKQRKYKQATEYFDQVFHEQMTQGFVYDPSFKEIIQTYLKGHQKEKAKQVLFIMLGNKEKDKRYKKLEKTFSFLLD
ncbi:hypothetical protein [Bacillus sp. PK3_68]|uniref:hypothetical protein n=1 Tax=Bacillus sp. PK3_68 TaxID=2027408 RepID=UPI000E7711B1|nr:hypothetical protein [Bacillus sp. PK3_68]RJS58987.1 hypothetical protein CJ483_02020 [Bacillus sp. PK3_68]